MIKFQKYFKALFTRDILTHNIAIKRYFDCQYLFSLLGSLHVKAEQKHVGEIDPRSPSPGGWETLS